ncbi:hypothetical protein [Treponema bryantii]|uniref:hypothetical protein n=1 Tax=Treponema bryantii TaxID=163 RepID=UPI0003B4775D|nr:hypothetical protein [Treponema bryantii]
MQGNFERIFERILVFTTSSSLMLAAAGIFSTVLNNYEVDKVFVDLFVYIVLGASGLIFSLVLQIFAIEKIKSAMHVVFIVFYEIAVLVLAALLGEGYAPYILIPALLVEYFIGVGINDMFIYHDRFIYECEGFEGKELETYLFHNNLVAIDLTEKTKGQQAVLFGLSVVMFIILVFGKLSQGYFNQIITMLVIVFYLSIMLCYYTLGLFKNDVFYAFLGFKNYIADKKKILRSVFLIILLASVFAALLSSNKALIKINYFLSEYDEQLNDNMPVHEDDFGYIPLPELNMGDDFGPEVRPNLILEIIFEFIKYAAIVAIAGAVLYFFIKPFFTRHWRVFWSEGKLIRFLRDVWSDIKSFFRFIFSKDDSSQAYSTVQAKSFQDSMLDFLKKAKRSKEKTAEIDRLTKQFMRLIDWGETHKIHYRANLAPAEYTKLIEQYFQTEDNKEAASNAGQLFEKALYDKEVLTAEEEKLFIESIKKVLQCE